MTDFSMRHLVGPCPRGAVDASHVAVARAAPGRSPGFRSHAGAARCVSALAGQWSESERALKSDQAVLGGARVGWGHRGQPTGDVPWLRS